MDNQGSFAEGSIEASAGEKVKCVRLYTPLDIAISRKNAYAA